MSLLFAGGFLLAVIFVDYLIHKSNVQILPEKILNTCGGVAFSLAAFTPMYVYYIECKSILSLYIFVFCNLDTRDNLIHFARFIIITCYFFYVEIMKPIMIFHIEGFIALNGILQYCANKGIISENASRIGYFLGIFIIFCVMLRYELITVANVMWASLVG